MIIYDKKTIDDVEVKGKRVLLRAEFNVCLLYTSPANDKNAARRKQVVEVAHSLLGTPYIPVSYTHLDVYKRQASRTA